ncbi:MAG: hypothetical protein U5K38_17195 [Woeseiaceae bacterium]|nr:hypothetical protein [Woeseiaceae bacterium]
MLDELFIFVFNHDIKRVVEEHVTLELLYREIDVVLLLQIRTNICARMDLNNIVASEVGESELRLPRRRAFWPPAMTTYDSPLVAFTGTLSSSKLPMLLTVSFGNV